MKRIVKKILPKILLAFILAGSVVCPGCAPLIEAAISSESGKIIATPPISATAGQEIDKYARPPKNLSQYPYKDANAAILNFDVTGGGLSSDEAELFSKNFRTDFIRADVQTVVNLEQMREVLSYQKFDLACNSETCAIEAGQILQVRYIIHGSIGKVERSFFINISMTDVELGKSVESARLSHLGSVENLLKTGVGRSVNCLLHSIIEKQRRAASGN